MVALHGLIFYVRLVNSPDLNAAVFVKVTQNIGTITDGRWVGNEAIPGAVQVAQLACFLQGLEWRI